MNSNPTRSGSTVVVPPGRVLRVLRVITRLNVGGPAQHVAYLTTGLVPHGFTTTLISGRIDEGEGDMGYFCEKVGARVEYLDCLVKPISPWKDICVLAKMVRILLSVRPDVLHTHLAKAGFISRIAAALVWPLGVRPIILHTYHGHVFHSYFSDRQNRLHLFLERLCARWTHRIIAVSTKLQAELVHRYKIAPESNFRVVPLGFDLSPFLARARKSGEFRRQIGVGGDTPLIGIVGRLTPVKDHSLFLDSFREILRTYPSAAAVIVGDGEDREYIQRYAEGLGIGDRVKWTGFMSDLPLVYGDLDILALTSRNEGTPVAVIEAQASGCPVVATDVGGTADAMPELTGASASEQNTDIVRRAGGYLVRHRTPGAFADACIRILRGDFKPAEDARPAVAVQFSSERLSEDIAHLYRNTLTCFRRPE